MKLSKSFFARLFWFVVGGVLSIAVNAGLFRLFCNGFGWNRYVGYALSLAIVNVLLFLWNYVVGFKTDRHWTDAAWRQVVCLSAANGLNYLYQTMSGNAYYELQGLSFFERNNSATLASNMVFRITGSNDRFSGTRI